MFKLKGFAFLTTGILAFGIVQAQQVCPSTSPVVKETSASGHSNVGITPPNVLILNRSWQNPRALLAGFSERAKTTLNAQYPGCGILITDNGSGVSDGAGGGTVRLAATHTTGCAFTQSLAEFWYNVVLSQLPECIPGYTLSADGHSCSSQEDTLLLCTSSVNPSTVDPARTMSECTDTCAVGNPTNVATGNKFQIEMDLEATEADSLEFIRYYNSSPLTVSSKMGPGWRHTFDRQLIFAGNPANSSTIPVVASVLRPDGSVIRFNVSSDGVIPTYPDLTETLNKQSNGTWVFTDDNDTVETYPAPTAQGNGQYSSLVSSIKFRSGLTQLLSYNGDKLVSVEDSFKHKLNFSYDSSQRLSSVSPVYRSGDPDAGNPIAQYSYGANEMLTSVAYPSSSSATRDYGYVQIQSPNGVWHWYLSNIKDENTGLIRSRWEYDAQGRVTKGAKTSGELDVYNFSYSTNNGTLESSVTTSNGTYFATSTYEFDTIQGLPRLTEYSGTSSVSLTRDAQTGRTSGRLKGSAQTILEYDSKGRLTRKSEAVGTLNARTTRITWHPTLRVPTEIEEYANGTGTGTSVRIETHELDDKGAITKRIEEDPAAGISRAWAITRTPYGRPLVVDGPASDSDIVRFTYYSCTQGEQGYECGRLKTHTNERGKVTTYSNYTVFGLPKTILDPNNVTTQITYDLRGRVLSKTTGGETTSFSYWPNGLLKRVILPDDSWTERTYTTAHWLSRITDQSGNYVQYTLDARGNPKEKRYRNASNNSWYLQTRVYDAYSRLVQEKSTTKPNGITEYDYGTDGNLDTVSAPLGRGLDYGYDELDRVASLVSPIAGSSLTSIYYDLADRVTTVIDPNGSATDYEYDGFGALTQVTSPDTGTTYYTYAPTSGRLTSSTDARDITTNYTFDSMGRPTFLSWADPGQNVQFVYDEASGVHGINQLTSTKVNSSLDLAFTYDANGRVVSRSQQVGGLSRLAQYEITNGRLTSITTPSNQVLSYAYSIGGRPTSVNVNGTPILTGVLHYPYGPLVSWSWHNGSTESRARNADGLPTGVTGTAGIGTVLGYDDALRIQSQTVTGLPAASWSYGYDLKDQLTTATPVSGQALEWDYDLNGNRSSQSGATPEDYDYSYSSNRLSQLDGVSILTDPTGNITDGGNGVTFIYGLRNRMTSSTNAQGTTTYSYNALGERVKKSGPGGTTIFTYDEEGHLIGEYNSAGGLIQEIVWLEGLPVASLRPAASGGGIEIFNISSDHLGTPRVIRRATDGVVVWRWDSDPFGNGLPNENPSGAGTFTFNLRFPGQYADAETGLNYNYFRDYNPNTGRYVQSDPIGLGGGLNTYSYVASNPIGSIDPSGEYLWVAAGGVIGAAVNVSLTAWSNEGLSNLSTNQIIAAGVSGFLSGSAGALGGPLGGTIARSMGRVSNGLVASVATGGLSAVGGVGGQFAANCIDPENASSIQNAAFWAGIGGGSTKYFFKTKNLNTFAQAKHIRVKRFTSLFKTINAGLNLTSFGVSAGVGSASNFPQLSVIQ